MLVSVFCEAVILRDHVGFIRMSGKNDPSSNIIGEGAG